MHSQEVISYQADLVSPIYGKILLIGTGKTSNKIKATFSDLANGKKGVLLIIKNKGNKVKIATDYWDKTIGSVQVISIKKGKKLTQEQQKKLNSANSIWLEAICFDKALKNQLKNNFDSLLKKGGLIGAKGNAAENLATIFQKGNKIKRGFNILPNSYISTRNDSTRFNKVIDKHPTKVGWNIPNEAAVVIHKGREISVIEGEEITLKVASNKNWSARIATLKKTTDFNYTADLISWNRSAVQRKQSLFPPKIAPIPNVENGALLIIGGGGYPKEMWKKVIDFSGGINANYVCISQTKSSYGAKKLIEAGCNNVEVFHTKVGTEGIGQGENLQLIEAIKKADAVYFGGGRTYKFMDAYLHTTVHQEMIHLLKRGGLVLGTSAGAQIQGDFLVRGDPRTNKNLHLKGNNEGLGFLKGVIIDAHFRERQREIKLPHLLVKYPQMLGIGIDEATAIFVKGSVAEVLGKNSVTFYNLNNYDKAVNIPVKKIGTPVIVNNGGKYDLKLRKKIE